MGSIDYILIATIVLVLGFAVICIWKSKKDGKKCIGCPDSATCSRSCGSCQGNCASCRTGK